MDRSGATAMAFTFILLAFVAPASAFGIPGAMDTGRDATTETYISAGSGNFVNHACTVDGANIGGVCFPVTGGEEYTFTITDDSTLAVGGEYRFNTKSGVGKSEFFCDGPDGVITAPEGEDVVLQIFVGGALNCGSIATTGKVTLN